jgi:hypothetical protein
MVPLNEYQMGNLIDAIVEVRIVAAMPSMTMRAPAPAISASISRVT